MYAIAKDWRLELRLALAAKVNIIFFKNLFFFVCVLVLLQF